MSETTETKTVTSTKAKGEIGPSMIGSEILVSALEREGVDTIFAYPGGASMEFHQALTRSEQIRTILPRHEQGGVFAAEGYARATGKAGVCMATSGPGATNLVTGIADAYMDSIPLVAITGQVPQAMIGKGGFQETDFFGMTLPVVKHSYLVTDVNEIPAVVKQAFKIATSGRPGPVVVDVPKNIQQTRAQVLFPDEVDIAGFDPEGLKASELELNEIVGLIEKSERPLLYVGGGIISADASDALRRLVAATGIPVTSTIMGVGAFPETHELSLRWLGMHGSAYANWAVSGEFEKDAEGNSIKVAEGADLLLAFGVRFDDRVTGKVEKFCEHGTIVHIDIDPSEINKNRKVALPVVSEIRYALEQLADMVSERPLPEKIHRMAEADRRVENQGAVWLSRDRRGAEIAAHEGSSRRLGGRSHPAADGHRDALRVDRRRSHPDHRRRPAPDVGRPILFVRQPPPTHHQRRAGGDGLRLPGGARGQGRSP